MPLLSLLAINSEHMTAITNAKEIMDTKNIEKV